MIRAWRRFEEWLKSRMGKRGFPTALACCAAAILPPTLTLIKVAFGGELHHPAWLLLTPAFALLAKLFAGADWLVAKRLPHVLLIAALLVAASLELVFVSRLLGIKLPI